MKLFLDTRTDRVRIVNQTPRLEAGLDDDGEEGHHAPETLRDVSAPDRLAESLPGTTRMRHPRFPDAEWRD